MPNKNKKRINKAKFRNDPSYRNSVRRGPKSSSQPKPSFKKPLPSYEEMKEKVNPPKTAMDSVSTMPRKMKADTMKQMKKKDMAYGGRKMENGGDKRKPAMRTTPTIKSEFQKVKNKTKSVVKKAIKKAPKVVKEVASYAVNPVGYVVNKATKGKKLGKKTKVTPKATPKAAPIMRMKKSKTPIMRMKKTKKSMTYGGKQMRYGGGKKGKKC